MKEQSNSDLAIDEGEAPSNVEARRIEDKERHLEVQMQSSHYSGPLPQPSDFMQYESVLPGASDRILSMAEKEQDARIADQAKAMYLAEKELNANIDLENKKLVHADKGLTFAFVIMLSFLAVAVVAGFSGHEVFGGILGTASLIAAYFIGGKDYLIKRAESSKNKKDK